MSSPAVGLEHVLHVMVMINAYKVFQSFKSDV